MSHFTLLVILPADTKNIEETVSNLLHPYYADLSEEEVNWNLKVRETLASYPDCLAVALNCHI